MLVATSAAADHDKTDVVTTDDGNTFIGEVDGVQYAQLTLDTDAAGTLTIEWRRVTSITSQYEYRVELNGGAEHFGSLGKPSKSGRLAIVTSTGPVEVALDEVFQIVPLDHGFWNSLDGDVTFGLTYTQANQALQYNFNANVARPARRHYAELVAQSVFNTQSDAESTEQHSLKFVVTQIVKRKWSSFEIAQVQSNPAQGYDLRVIAGGGAANFLVERSTRVLVLNMGAVYNRESVVDSSEVEDSAEALIGLAFRRFKRGSYSPRLQVGLQTFTNLTDRPRFRLAFNFNLSWQIFNNFTVNLQANDSYDTDPPGTGAEHNDLSLVTSLGYSF